MILTEEEYLAHYGILRKSGRYPWGSGNTQSARNRTYLDTIADLKRQGMSDAQAAECFGLTSNQLRAARSIALNEQKQTQRRQAEKLKEKGNSNVAIGERMGLNESSVRALLAPGAKEKADILLTTANMLRDQVNEKKFLDVGSGVENQLGISQTKLATAVAVLREEGYEVHSVKLPQVGTGKMTEYKILCPPGTTQRDLFLNRTKIQQIQSFSEDGGRTFLGIHPPLSISSKRVGINYAEDGGTHADGVIYVRPGVKDVSIGASRYAQVRIKVDDTHYLKGMAVYKDDLPKGVDLVFNTNKSDTGNKLDALKPLKDDEDNPFGAVIRQRIENGKVTSAMNIVGSPTKEGSGEEGAWDTWSKNLPSQFLSKQSPELAKSQLDVTFERRRKEFDKLSELTNPAVRKKLLETFAEETDSAAVHLQAANMPGQATKVILPVSSMKPTEVYAPSYQDGTRLALVRFPHGGTFEIPQLTVNNKNPEAKKLLGTSAIDAIGIHHTVAERLSGADFDGDTVLAIPNNLGSVKSTPPLEGLKGFDPKASYPPYDGMRTIAGGTYSEKLKDAVYGPRGKNTQMQNEMGQISNLITDMTIKGANTQELAQAVRHSMVVIDAEKHHLDHRASYKENGIPALKETYQGGKRAGASTLISKAGSEVRIKERKDRPAKEGGGIDPATGKRVYVDTNATRRAPDGSRVDKTIKIERLALTDDANTLLSGIPTPIERLYADHSNRLKSLANAARKETLAIKPIKQSDTAKKVYKPEVDSLSAKLNLAQKNRPLERQAQVVANTIVAQKKRDNPGMERAEEKKIRNQALIEARIRTGAGKERIHITDEEWAAIQAGAISNSKLTDILRNADIDRVRELATPRADLVMTSSMQARATAMLKSGYSQADIARQLGVKVSTLNSSIKG